MKLSIITVNLNNATGLKLTLESVSKQTFDDFEHIIVDGASEDESVAIIKQYQKQNSSLPVLWSSEPDHGIYHAMNLGIGKASGDYLFFLNSGDYLSSPALLARVFSSQMMEDVVFGNLCVFIGDRLLGVIHGKKELTFMDLYLSNVVKHQSSFIRRTLFQRCGLYDENLQIVADFEFFLRTLGSSKATYRYMDLDIAYFENSGLSNNRERVVKKERESVLSKYLNPMQLADYKNYEFLFNYLPVTRYGLFRFIMKILRRSAKILQRIWR